MHLYAMPLQSAGGNSSFDYLHVFEVGFDGDGYEIRQFHQKSFGARTTDAQQSAFVAVENAPDNPNRTAAHRRCQFLRQVVPRIRRTGDGAHENIHVGVGDDHRFTVFAAATVAVLERRRLFDYRVEDGRAFRGRTTGRG